MLLFIATAALLASMCDAHPAQLVAAHATFDRDGRFRVAAKFDLLAFALNDTPARIDDASMNALIDGSPDVLAARLKDAAERFRHGVTVLCGDDRAIVRGDSVQFPTIVDLQHWKDSGIRPRLPVIQEAVVEGRLPEGTRCIALRFPEVMGPVVVTIERPGEEPLSEPIEAGQASLTLPLALAIAPSPTPAAPSVSRAYVALRYVALGFTHILPKGPDHILFVLGLFLLTTRLKPLLWQVTAFTVAHSITLALALYGVVRLPSVVVEPLIAASIAFVALENLTTTDLKPWRPFVVFAFGLVHGLGFAGALGELGLPRNQFATALVTFNIGVELGQLAVIALAFTALGWWRQRSWYRRAIVLPASCAIAAIAIVWTIQRV
jgi:hypothetical protein